MIDGLYDRAAAAAATPSDWVTLCLQRAAYLHQKNDSAGEMTLYQQILADAGLRSVIVANGENAASPAGTLARNAVSDLIQRCGPAIYAPYEQKAVAAVQSAMSLPSSAQAPQLVAIADMFPNSQAATGAILSAADDYEAGGSPRESAALMRQFCSRYPDSPQRPRAIESLARAYLEMPNRVDGLNVAIGRLEQGANLAGQQKLSRPLRLPDGTQVDNVTFAQAADALRSFQARIATRALPDPRIPGVGRHVPGEKKPAYLPEDPGALLTDISDLVLPLRDWARQDRIVTFSSSQGLGVYTVGSNHPLFTCPAVTEAPRNVAWTGGNLLVWCPSGLLLIRGDGAAASTTMPSVADIGRGIDAAKSQHAGDVIWDAPLHTLPAAQFASVGTGDDNDATASAAGGDDVDPAAQPPVNGTVTINGQRIVVRGNGRIILGRGGQLQIVNGRILPPVMMRAAAGMAAGANQPNVPANPNGDNTVEEIDRLVPTGDRLVFSTSGGEASSRVVSLNLADGRVLWQTSLEDHQIDQLAANDDFVVIRASNDTDMRLVAFDAITGQPVWRPRPFGRENNDTDVPINICLAEDGSLVYLTADHICCKDLFDPDPKLRFDREISRSANNINGIPNAIMPANTFPGATAPDQLAVSDGRVMAVSDNGTFVRVYSLADGKPYRRGPDGESLLNTEVTNSPWNVHLRVVGTKLYIFGPDKVLHYDLDNADDVWSNTVDTSNGPAQTTVSIRDLILTKQDVLMLLEPASAQHRDPGAAYSPTLFLRPYSRELTPAGRETGLVRNFDRMLNGSASITKLQVVDGGIYYATADHEVHFLKGVPAETAK
jgi:outer membrane protein assembly factor BamB